MNTLEVSIFLLKLMKTVGWRHLLGAYGVWHFFIKGENRKYDDYMFLRGKTVKVGPASLIGLPDYFVGNTKATVR